MPSPSTPNRSLNTMKNNTDQILANAPELQADEGLDVTACSPVFPDTLETDAVTGGADVWNAFEDEIIALARKLERQRNGLMRIARDYIEDLDDSGDEAKAKDYRRWLNQILLEQGDHRRSPVNRPVRNSSFASGQKQRGGQ